MALVSCGPVVGAGRAHLLAVAALQLVSFGADLVEGSYDLFAGNPFRVSLISHGVWCPPLAHNYDPGCFGASGTPVSPSKTLSRHPVHNRTQLKILRDVPLHPGFEPTGNSHDASVIHGRAAPGQRGTEFGEPGSEMSGMLHVLIIEPHDELALAFEKVIASASYTPIVRRHVDSLEDLDVTPATIVMRIGHADVSHLPSQRPPIVAIASSDEEVAEASRLRCEVVLHGPAEVKRLCEALRSVVHS
jgi:hypothetical protein